MKNYLNMLGWFVTLLIPFVLLLTSIRLVLTRTYINLEYHLPGFPEDPYGMTLEERNYYAPILMVDYPLNDQDISFLADMKFEDGSPLLNERELSHMEDVKSVARPAFGAWLLMIGFITAVGVAARRWEWWDQFQLWLRRGAQATIGLIAAILVFVAISFNALFTAFHRIFFEGDSWLFQFSDTLIRLYPLRFWQDVFITVGVLTLLVAGLIWWGFAGKKVKVAGRKKK